MLSPFAAAVSSWLLLIIAAVEQVGYCFVRHFRRATAAGERPSIARLPRRRTRGER